LVLRDRGSERFYVLHDAVSVTAIIDTSGAVQERYGYDAFGYGRVMDANFGARSSSNYDWEVRYGAYRWDSESGLYQVRNRYLHPKLGRWVSRDPVEYEEALNVYVYAINNAITLIDPTGLATTLARCESDKQTALAGDPIIRKLLEALRRHGCRMPTIECDCCEMRTGTSNPGRGGYYTNYSIVLCIETLPPYQAGNPTFAGVLAHELTHALQHCTRGCMPRGCDEAACGEVEAVCTAQQCKGVVPFEQCVARLAAVSLTAFCPKGEGLKAAEAAIARGCCKSKVP
jgi:RHS repeat-associated protein